MDREQAKEYILMRATDILRRDGSKKGYVCPICGSGSGKKGTGMTTKDGKHFTCWTGCFTSADIIDIIGLQEGISDYNGKLQAAATKFGITIDKEYHKPTAKEDFAPPDDTQRTIHNTQYTIKETKSVEPKQDYTQFFIESSKHIEETDYHRGISLETLKAYKIGYAEKWRHPKAPQSVPTSPRLIIPTSRYSYVARDTRENLTEQEKEYSKSKVGTVHIFNAKALRTADRPIYLVEGELDALSIIDVGGAAIGLGSVSNAKLFLQAVSQIPEAERSKFPILIMMDNDEAGEKAKQVIVNGLDELQIRHYEESLPAPYKDANEMLQADRDALSEIIGITNSLAAEEQEREQEAIKAALKRESAAYSVQSFIDDIKDSEKAQFIPTGFHALDNILDGGLYAGLYVVGAISSLGKTTFCLQLADSMAAAGHDVLIFSLEMARNELMAKSISRLTLIENLRLHKSTAQAKTTRGILTGSRYASYTDTEKGLILSALNLYKEYAQNIYITEGVGNVDIAAIRKKVENHYSITGKAPIVLIDYLQIIAPTDMRATDKQNTDKAVLELKRLSRDYNIPVIGISSFNRENYTAPVNLTSFKESGAIEYSSDVLIGLQYDGMDYQDGEKEKDSSRNIRIRELTKGIIEKSREGKAINIQVKILKNRNGGKGDCVLQFFPMFNYFYEAKEQKGNNDGWGKTTSSYNIR